MGLDINVYNNIRVVSSKEEEAEDFNFRAMVYDESWNHKIKNLEKGKFYIGDSMNLEYNF